MKIIKFLIKTTNKIIPLKSLKISSGHRNYCKMKFLRKKLFFSQNYTTIKNEINFKNIRQHSSEESRIKNDKIVTDLNPIK